MAKLFATEAAQRIVDRAVQIHGGLGVERGTRGRTALSRGPRAADLRRHVRDPAPGHRAQCAADIALRLRTRPWIADARSAPASRQQSAVVSRHPHPIRSSVDPVSSVHRDPAERIRHTPIEPDGPMRRSSGLAPVQPAAGRTAAARRSHLGAGDGAVARHRRRLRHRRRARSWYERFAAGQPGAIVVEATGVRDIPSGPLLRIGDDRFIPGLRELVDAVRRASGGRTKLFIQIIDFLADPPAAVARDVLRPLPADHRRASACGDGAGGRGRSSATRRPQVRAALLALPDEQLRAGPQPRASSRRWTSGYRERVTDVEQPHIRDLPRRAARHLRRRRAPRRGGRLRRRRAALTRTPTRWRRSSRRGTRGRTATAVRARTASGCRSRSSTPSAPRRLGPLRRRLPLPERRLHRGRQHGGRCGVVRGGVRAGRHGLPVAVARRQVRGREAAEGRLGRVSLHRPERLGMHADRARGRRRTVRPQRRAGGSASAQAIRAAGLTTPVVVAGGIHTFEQAEAILASGAGGHHRRGAPVAGGSRLVPEDADRPRRRDPRLLLHQLLRGARPDAQAGHLQALGPRGARRAGDCQEQSTASGGCSRRER